MQFGDAPRISAPLFTECTWHAIKRKTRHFKNHTLAIWYARLCSVAPLAAILNLWCFVFTTCQRHCLHKGLHHLSTSSETDRWLCPCRATLRGSGGGLVFVKLWLWGSWQPDQPFSGIGLVSTVYLNYDLNNPSHRVASWVCHVKSWMAFNQCCQSHWLS